MRTPTRGIASSLVYGDEANIPLEFDGKANILLEVEIPSMRGSL